MPSTEVQSIVFERSKWSLEGAKSWIRKNNYKISFHGKPVDIKRTQYRFRQTAPNYPNYVSKKLGDGVMLVLGVR